MQWWKGICLQHEKIFAHKRSLFNMTLTKCPVQRAVRKYCPGNNLSQNRYLYICENDSMEFTHWHTDCILANEFHIGIKSVFLYVGHWWCKTMTWSLVYLSKGFAQKMHRFVMRDYTVAVAKKIAPQLVHRNYRVRFSQYLPTPFFVCEVYAMLSEPESQASRLACTVFARLRVCKNTFS